MKKCLRTGKKALSVFMAVLMALTAMVFAAPQKASAISNGNYNVSVVIWTTNGFDTQDKKGLTLYVNYKDSAGATGQATHHVNEEWFDTPSGKEVGRNDKYKNTINMSVPGFPTSINLPGSKNNDGLVQSKGSFELDIYVNGAFLGTVKASFEKKESFNPTFTPSAAQLPKATSVVWTKSPTDITIPSDLTSATTTAESYCVDQYGVRLGIEPSYTVTYAPSEPADGLSVSTASDNDKASVTVSANKNACLSGDGNNVRTATIQTNYSYNGVPTSTEANPTTKTFKIIDPSYNVTLLDNGGEIKTQTPLTKQWGDSYGSLPYAIRDGYTLIGFYPSSEGPQGPFNDGESQPKGEPLTADYVIYADSSWYPVWRINQYTATFNYKDENYADTSTSTKIYVGSAITVPEIPTTINPNVDHTYTFTGWDKEIDSVMPANDVVYTAQYSDTIHYADYTEVEKQIAAANEKKAEALFNEGAYTPETVTALENALSTAVDSNNNKLLKSQQSQVDNIAANLESAIENLKFKTFTVLFVDESGAIIKDGYFYVNYGDKVEVPAAPSKESDATYHYEFTGWDSDSDELSACDKVVDDLKYIAKFNAVEHSFTDTATPSDCSADGVITHTCDCGYTYTSVNESDKAHHTWSEDYKELVPATCATKGSEAKYCTVCGAIDESSTREIDVLGHSWGEWSEEVSATCTGKGMKVRECTRCGGKDVEEIPVAGHKWGETTVVAPTCTVGGYSTHTCEACDITEIFDLTNATGHNLSTSTTVEATCVAAGYKETKCSNTGCDYDVVETIPATGEHTYGEETVLTTANCISDGISEKECTVCHKVERTITPKLSEHDFGEWTVLANASCTTDEIQQRSCKICGTTETKTIANTAHHTWDSDDNYIVDIPATCTTAGSESIHCTVCGISNKETAREIEKLGHDYTNARTETHSQDCVSGEYTKTFCTRAGCDHYELVFAEGEKGEALGHDFSGTETVVTPPTCEADGVKSVQCTRCDSTEEQVIPKLGHDYAVDHHVDPDCTTSGYDVMVCKNDATHTYKRYDGTSAKGHDWNEWQVVTASTNDNAGLMKRTCKNCDATEEVEIPKGGHRFDTAKGTEIKAATCKVGGEGEMEYACVEHVDADGNNTCGVKITVEIARIPHELTTDVKNATCEEDGYIKTYCKICGEVVYSTVLASPKQHTWGDWQTKVEETCGKPGIRIRFCKVCGASEEAEIPATGKHNYAKTVVPPTCTQQGYTIFACMGCGVTYRDFFVAPLGHDMKDDWVDVAETCTTPGGRQRACHRTWEDERGVTHKCDYVEFEEDPARPATGHSFSEWKFVTHPSVKDAYAKWRQCMNTGCTHTEYEKGEKGSESVATKDGVNIYYQVNYYNEWATDTYDVLTGNLVSTSPTKTYTKLAKTYKTEKLATIYVLKGQAAVYPNKLSPVREKDADWGEYVFEGWTEKGQKALDKDASVEPANPLDLSKISENTDVYALFRCKDRYYRVVFYNANGSMLTIAEHILHGHSAEWPADFGTPTLPENNEHMYKFKGWSYDFSKIYDDVAIIAQYDSIMKSYVVVYHDWNGKELGRETIAYGDPAVNIPAVAERPEDNTYVYQFLNKWALANGEEVNLESFTAVPDGAKDGDEVHVYAKHSQRLKVYKVNLRVWDPFGMTCGGATVQVINSQGRLVASTTTDVDGYAYLSLNYSTAYSVKISRGNYALEGTMTLDTSAPGSIPLTYDITQNLYRNYNVSLIDYTNSDDKPEEKCNCICHSFIGGLWITVLNLIYRLFKVKQVCCYDMYVVHGDKLVYGPN